MWTIVIHIASRIFYTWNSLLVENRHLLGLWRKGPYTVHRIYSISLIMRILHASKICSFFTTTTGTFRVKKRGQNFWPPRNGFFALTIINGLEGKHFDHFCQKFCPIFLLGVYPLLLLLTCTVSLRCTCWCLLTPKVQDLLSRFTFGRFSFHPNLMICVHLSHRGLYNPPTSF